MNKKVDVIVLSLAKDDNSLARTNSCVHAYLKTADKLINKIYVLETNIKANLFFDDKRVEIIYPNIPFNYNQFFNIALKKCTADFVMGPNNDLVVHENCLHELVNTFEKYPNVASLCPIDRNWHRHTKVYLPSEKTLYLGYETSLHMFGCVVMCRRSIFEKIGYLDERFFFFYQDNDYIMSLQRLNLLHGVYTGAHITHESGGSNSIATGRCTYTSKNMSEQGDIFMNKWFKEEPFCSGGYKQFKPYP